VVLIEIEYGTPNLKQMFSAIFQILWCFFRTATRKQGQKYFEGKQTLCLGKQKYKINVTIQKILGGKIAARGICPLAPLVLGLHIFKLFDTIF